MSNMQIMETMTRGEIMTVRIAYSEETLIGLAFELGVEQLGKEDLRAYLSDIIFRKCQKLTKDGITIMSGGKVSRRRDTYGSHKRVRKNSAKL